MYKNKNLCTDIDRVLASCEQKYIISEDSVIALLRRKGGEIVLPISIFSGEINFLGASSAYLKDEFGLSFGEIAGFLKRNIRSVERAYIQAKKKAK